ncbi:MAG: hypothetical protein WCL04_02900 [Verrucomicrobiota bacterium]
MLGVLMADMGFRGFFDDGQHWLGISRNVDGGHLHQIGQTMINEETEQPGVLYTGKLPDIYAVAAQLARNRMMTNPQFWLSRADPAYDPWKDRTMSYSQPATIVNPTPGIAIAPINPKFQSAPLAVAVALFPPGTHLKDLPSQTPIAWTRGLQSDGTWRDDSPYGDWGGYVVFADGTLIQFSHGIGNRLVKFGTSQPTSSIAQALPVGTRVSEYQPLPGSPSASRAAHAARLAEIGNSVLETGVVVLLPLFIVARMVIYFRGGRPPLATLLNLACVILFLLMLVMMGL